MIKRRSVREFNKRFRSGCYTQKEVKVQIDAGWFDWVCDINLLAKKTQKIGFILTKIKSGGKVDMDKWFVWFKNNHLPDKSLYDDFRFSNIETGALMFVVQINCKLNKNKYVAYGRTVDGFFHLEKPLFQTNSEKELVDWLNRPWAEIQ